MKYQNIHHVAYTDTIWGDPTIFILTSPEAVACEPGERDHLNVPIPIIMESNAHIVDLLQPSMQTSPKNAAVVPKR